MFRTLVIAIGALALAGAARAQAVKSFKDWSVVCDNLRTCSAFGYTEEGADTDAFIRIVRPGGPAGTPRVTLRADAEDGDDGKAPLTWRISVDGQVPPSLAAVAARAGESERRAELTPAQSAALIGALRSGAALTILGGKAPIAISLAGSSAALLWMDDRQGRVGTTTALVARGPKPASAVPPAPAPPMVRAAPPAPQTGLPTKLPALIRNDRRLKDCDDPEAAKFDPIVARLAPGEFLWAAPCSAGAYNLLSVLFVADEAGRGARELIPPDAEAPNPDADDELMNIDYDAKTRTLSAFAKARGLGDCGAATRWVWDGKAFALLDEQVMPDCRGVTADDWPSLYHAVRAP
jgi:hypothetical protein